MAVHRMVEKMSSLKIKTPTYQITTNYFIKRVSKKAKYPLVESDI